MKKNVVFDFFSSFFIQYYYVLHHFKAYLTTKAELF